MTKYEFDMKWSPPKKNYPNILIIINLKPYNYDIAGGVVNQKHTKKGQLLLAKHTD
jgi:hypothetical protein